MENESYCKKIILLQKKLFLRLTPEENYEFKKIFHDLDKNKNGYIKNQTAIDFLKRPDLPEEKFNQIKNIWKIQNGRFYPNEFYIALRLIALAQNNFFMGNYLPFKIKVKIDDDETKEISIKGNNLIYDVEVLISKVQTKQIKNIFVYIKIINYQKVIKKFLVII